MANPEDIDKLARQGWNFFQHEMALRSPHGEPFSEFDDAIQGASLMRAIAKIILEGIAIEDRATADRFNCNRCSGSFETLDEAIHCYESH